MNPRSLARVALAALVGCVDASRPVSRGAARAVVQERARDEAAERARQAALPTVPMVQRERPRVVAREGEVAHVIAGPLRYDLRGEVASPAEDVPDAPITGAARGARGWVFVAGAAVYASERFTGALRLLRSFACEGGAGEPGGEPVRLRPSAGRVALTALAYGSFWSDGASLEALDVPGAVASAWRDAAHGAVIVEHRALRVTADGGRTWREVDTRGETPVLLEGSAEGLTVATERGARRIDEQALALAPAPARAERDEPACPPGSFSGVAPFDRGYARAPAAAPAETCAQRDARRPNGWAPLAFDVTLEGVVRRPPANEYVGETWGFTRTTAAPFGPPWARSYVDTGLATALARVTARPRQRVYQGGLSWRGRDTAGPFLGVASVRQPVESPPDSRWELLAATRRGALIQLEAGPPGRRLETPEGDDGPVVTAALFWVTPTGLRRVPLDPARSLEVSAAFADDAGGVVVLGEDMVQLSQPCEGRAERWAARVLYALHVGPDGGLRGERAVVAEEAVRAVVGAGQRGERWGLVVAERASPGGLQWLPFTGGREDFGAWSLGATPRACGEAAGEGTRLHVGLSPDDERSRVFVGQRALAGEEQLAGVRHVTLERAGEGLCVRRVAGVSNVEDVELSPENFRTAHGVLDLRANAGRLAGTYDDGRRVATLTATLGAAP